MMLKALSSDFLKIKGKGIWFLVFLGPIGLIAMQALNFGLRYDYMTKTYADNLWGVLLENISIFVPIALYLGITLISSMLANVEHHMGSWKQLLALPISKTAVFMAKFTLSVLLLSLSCVLLAVGTVTLGLLLGFDANIPIWDIVRLSVYPYLASLPVMALMLWLCMSFKNQALSITLGVVMAVFSIMPIAEWLPISWPLLGYTGPKQEMFVGAGLLSGLILLVIGTVHFSRKDVN